MKQCFRNPAGENVTIQLALHHLCSGGGAGSPGGRGGSSSGARGDGSLHSGAGAGPGPAAATRVAWAVDGGANLGSWTTALLHHFEEEAAGRRCAGVHVRVAAFEPINQTFVQLRAALGSDPRVQLVQAAISERDGEVSRAAAGRGWSAAGLVLVCALRS